MPDTEEIRARFEKRLREVEKRYPGFLRELGEEIRREAAELEGEPWGGE